MAVSGWTVVKVGGEVLEGPSLAAFAAEVAGLRAAEPDGALAIVHGGGPQTSAMQRRLGQEPNVVAGRRVTDEATLDVLKMVVAGRLSVDLVAALCAVDVRAVGLHGASGGVIRARRRSPRTYGGVPEPIDLGLVGDVEGFNVDLLARLADGGFVPTLACLGADAAGGVYNINADVVANQLAVALHARRLVLVTGAPGVLADLADPTTRIPVLDPASARAAIADGRIRGGMIPKVEESLAVLGPVGEVLVVGGPGGLLVPGTLVRAVREPGSVGTVLRAAP